MHQGSPPKMTNSDGNWKFPELSKSKVCQARVNGTLCAISCISAISHTDITAAINPLYELWSISCCLWEVETKVLGLSIPELFSRASWSTILSALLNVQHSSIVTSRIIACSPRNCGFYRKIESCLPLKKCAKRHRPSPMVISLVIDRAISPGFNTGLWPIQINKSTSSDGRLPWFKSRSCWTCSKLLLFTSKALRKRGKITSNPDQTGAV